MKRARRDTTIENIAVPRNDPKNRGRLLGSPYKEPHYAAIAAAINVPLERVREHAEALAGAAYWYRSDTAARARTAPSKLLKNHVRPASNAAALLRKKLRGDELRAALREAAYLTDGEFHPGRVESAIDAVADLERWLTKVLADGEASRTASENVDEEKRVSHFAQFSDRADERELNASRDWVDRVGKIFTALTGRKPARVTNVGGTSGGLFVKFLMAAWEPLGTSRGEDAWSSVIRHVQERQRRPPKPQKS